MSALKINIHMRACYLEDCAMALNTSSNGATFLWSRSPVRLARGIATCMHTWIKSRYACTCAFRLCASCVDSPVQGSAQEDREEGRKLAFGLGHFLVEKESKITGASRNCVLWSILQHRVACTTLLRVGTSPVINMHVWCVHTWTMLNVTSLCCYRISHEVRQFSSSSDLSYQSSNDPFQAHIMFLYASDAFLSFSNTLIYNLFER